MKIEVILTPAELPGLQQRDLSQTTCVVFDVLRATSAFVTALHNGARAIIPVSEISEALAVKNSEFGIRNSEFILLGGERDGVRIRAAQTGGVDFDLGNSPREYTPEKVRGKNIVSTTTNGTRALRAGAGAKTVIAASFLNLAATAKFLRQILPAHVVLVCAGTRENTALEDVLAAGALCEMLEAGSSRGDERTTQRAIPAGFSDSAEIARRTFAQAKANLAATVATSENARRLLAIPELREDVSFCLQHDIFPLVARLEADGIVPVPV